MKMFNTKSAGFDLRKRRFLNEKELGRGKNLVRQNN